MPTAAGARGVAGQSCLPWPGCLGLPHGTSCRPRTLCVCAGPGGAVHHPSRVTEHPHIRLLPKSHPNPSACGLGVHARKPTVALVVHEGCQSTGQGETQQNGKISVSFLCILEHLQELNRASSLFKAFTRT